MRKTYLETPKGPLHAMAQTQTIAGFDFGFGEAFGDLKGEMEHGNE